MKNFQTLEGGKIICEKKCRPVGISNEPGRSF